MSSVYSEVTAAYSRDRVLEKFDTAYNTLPYSIDDIKISHNDYLLGEVYNDVINKLYFNWLFLIANAEIFTATSPTSAVGSYNFNSSYSSSLGSLNTTASGTATLSTINEINITKFPNSTNNLIISYGRDNSYIFKTNNDYTSITGLLTGQQAEFNKSFEFSNIKSVDVSGDFLFILDSGTNSLYKFDISGLLYSDPAISRTGINDTTHPGRYLVKAVGGKGKTTRKNKLTNPESIKIYNNEIYVLDNGNFSIKVYDLNFNFVRDLVDKDLFLKDINNKPISITIDRESDISSTGKIFVLTKNGTITTYTVDFKNKQTYNPFGGYSSKFDSVYNEQRNFKKIVASKSNKNILYIITNKNIIKFYKTNLNKPINFFTNISINSSSFEQINSLDVESISGVDNLVFTSHLSSGKTKYSVVKDDNTNRKLYHNNCLSNYFTLDNIKINPQEVVNSVTFNKTTEKIIYNHSSFFENIHKKVYGKYSDSRTPIISTVIESTFALPSSFNITNDFYIGLNEPLLTDIINRPILKLYEQQEDLFNILKETFLNTNPPTNISEVLESKKDVVKKQKIQFVTLNQTVTAGSPVVYNITRDTTQGVVNFKLYNTTGVGTLTTVIDGFVLEDKPVTFSFDKGISSLSAVFYTESFKTGNNRTFDTIIFDPNSGAVIDQNNYIRTTTVKPSSAEYVISLSATNPSTVQESNSSTFAVIRTNAAYNTFFDEISCNIFTTNITTSDSDFQIIGSNGNYNGNPASDFMGLGNSQVSALSVHSTGTLVFQPGVSSIFLSISATRDAEDSGEIFSINLSNPDDSSKLSNKQQRITILEKLEPIDLNLNSSVYSINPGTNFNIWDVLSADSTYQNVSTTYPISARLTIDSSTFTDPLTVYSTDVNKGAIYLDAGTYTEPFKPGSILHIVVPANTYIVGKGGAGGSGIQWDSTTGTDLTNTNSITINGLVDSSDNFLIDGQDGGPAITLSAFDYFSVENSGYIYGGAGGGGAGVLPITANNMPEWNPLSASSGGGGGAGIGSNGFGTGGSKYTGVGNFVNNGSDGSQSSGGAGGTINLPAPAGSSTFYKVMSGADGGNLGQPGGGDDIPDDYVGRVYTWNADVSALAFRGEGGTVGEILSGAPNWNTKANDINTGTFLGSDV